jgi:hypothetical protein
MCCLSSFVIGGIWKDQHIVLLLLEAIKGQLSPAGLGYIVPKSLNIERKHNDKEVNKQNDF